MQVYRGLPILTNQPSTADPSRRDLAARATRRRWPSTPRSLTPRSTRSWPKGRTPVVVGGTGLYLRAALADLEVPPAPPTGMRERLEALYERVGPARTHALLVERDPAAAETVHPNDRRRVVRALELVEAGASLRPEVEPALERGAPPSDARRRPRRAARDPGRANRGANAGDAGHGSARRGVGGRGREALRDGAPRDRPPGAHRASRRGSSGRDRAPHPTVRRLPAQVDAADSRPR